MTESDGTLEVLQALTEAARTTRIMLGQTVDQLQRELAEIRDGMTELDERIAKLAYQAELRGVREARL